MRCYISICHGIIRNDSAIEQGIMRYCIYHGVMRNNSAIEQGVMRYGIFILIRFRIIW